MPNKIFAVFILLLVAILGTPSTTPAAFQIGMGTQLRSERLTLDTTQINWWFTDNWALRGEYSWNAGVLEMAALYKINPRAQTAFYLGLGENDLSEPRLLVKQTNLIIGVEWDLSRIKPGLSVMIEALINPNDFLNQPNASNGSASGLGISLDYRFPPINTADIINDINSTDILAKLITLEAPDEPFEGQVAVAAVVLNRIRSNDFPDSVRKVVYQRGQFKTARKLARIVPGESAVTAAKAALRGKDPSHGALYFYNPATCSPKARRYIKNAHFQITARIGNHVFLK